MNIREKLADFSAREYYTTLEQSRGKVGEFMFYKKAEDLIAIFKEFIGEMFPPEKTGNTFEEGVMAYHEAIINKLEVNNG